MYKFKYLNEITSVNIIEAKNWLDEMGIKNYRINKDGTVDVEGDVNISKKELKEIPVQFGVVEGNFNCSFNQLTSLEGAPNYVGEDFSCYFNQLISLKESPIFVDKNFNCSYNQLVSLDGAPKYVGGDFYCEHNARQFSKKDVMDVCKVQGKIAVK